MNSLSNILQTPSKLCPPLQVNLLDNVTRPVSGSYEDPQVLPALLRPAAIHNPCPNASPNSNNENNFDAETQLFSWNSINRNNASDFFDVTKPNHLQRQNKLK